MGPPAVLAVNTAEVPAVRVTLVSAKENFALSVVHVFTPVFYTEKKPRDSGVSNRVRLAHAGYVRVRFNQPGCVKRSALVSDARFHDSVKSNKKKPRDSGDGRQPW